MAIQRSAVDEGPKDKLEGRLTRKLSGFLARQHKDLRRQMGTGERPPEEFWTQFETGLSEILKTELGAAARDGAESVMEQLPSEKKSGRQIVINLPEELVWQETMKVLMEQQAIATKANADAILELARAHANQPAPVVNVPAPIVNVEAPVVNVPAPEAVKAAAGPVGPKSRREVRRLTRDQKGNITGSEVQVQYEYEE